MNVVFVVYRYWPSIGGVETYVHELAKAVRDAGHEVMVVAGAHVENLPPCETHEGIEIHRFPRLRSLTRCRGWFACRLPQFRRADVIQVSNTHMLEFFHKMVRPVVPRSRVFLTRHGMSGKYPVPQTEIDRAVHSLQYCSGVVHDGQFIEQWLGVRPDACPDQGLSPKADELIQVPCPARNSATYVGRLEPDTGIRDYIEGVRILNQELGRRFSLEVYGEGSLEQVLRDETARHELPIRFHGARPDARDRLSETAFAFVDGRMAIQEAFARRRVVLSCYRNRWKRSYLCGETFSPFLIAVQGTSKLAQQVVELIDRPEQMNSIVEKAFAFSRTLSWNRTAEAYINLWQRSRRQRKPASQSARMNYNAVPQ